VYSKKRCLPPRWRLLNLCMCMLSKTHKTKSHTNHNAKCYTSAVEKQQTSSHLNQLNPKPIIVSKIYILSYFVAWPLWFVLVSVPVLTIYIYMLLLKKKTVAPKTERGAIWFDLGIFVDTKSKAYTKTINTYNVKLLTISREVFNRPLGSKFACVWRRNAYLGVCCF